MGRSAAEGRRAWVSRAVSASPGSEALRSFVADASVRGSWSIAWPRAESRRAPNVVALSDRSALSVGATAATALVVAAPPLINSASRLEGSANTRSRVWSGPSPRASECAMSFSCVPRPTTASPNPAIDPRSARRVAGPKI